MDFYTAFQRGLPAQPFPGEGPSVPLSFVKKTRVRISWALQEGVLPEPRLGEAWGRPGETAKSESGFCRDSGSGRRGVGDLAQGKEG